MLPNKLIILVLRFEVSLFYTEVSIARAKILIQYKKKLKNTIQLELMLKSRRIHVKCVNLNTEYCVAMCVLQECDRALDWMSFMTPANRMFVTTSQLKPDSEQQPLSESRHGDEFIICQLIWSHGALANTNTHGLHSGHSLLLSAWQRRAAPVSINFITLITFYECPKCFGILEPMVIGY